MANNTRKKLTSKECKQKAIECRELALQARQAEHRTMLLQMAETWERIAQSSGNHG
jgi:hypothetical protein